MVQNEQLLVAGIVGSLRQASHTRKVVALALEGAQEAGVRTRLVDLRDYDLPFQDGSDEVEENPEVLRLRRDMGASRGIIIGTPEYHGGYSGVLKNALDLMGFEEFEGKMVGLVGVAGGAVGAMGALHDLRGVGRALHAWVVPEQASVPRAGRMFDAHGQLTDARLAERVKDVGRQVAKFTCLHGSNEWRDFLELWEKAPENPGGPKR